MKNYDKEVGKSGMGKKNLVKDADDPLGLRKVVLGGDAPTLSSEAAFVRRRILSKDQRNNGKGGKHGWDIESESEV